MRVAHPAISAVLLLAGWSALCGEAARAKPGGPWWGVRTRHFELYGNAPAPKIEAIGRDLERFREAVSLVAPELDLVARRPLRIYVFKDWRSSRRYLPATGEHDRPGGLFLRHPDAAFLIVHAGPELDASATIYHEYAHCVVEQNLPHVPLWLHEGLAELFGTFWANEFDAEVGQPVTDYVKLLGSERLYSPGELSAVRGDSAAYREPRSKALFHAQSWALTHFLLLESPMTPSRFSSSLAGLARGEAAETAFPVLDQPETLPAAVRAHLERIGDRVLRLQLNDTLPRSAIVTTEMPRDESLRRLGELLAHQGADRAGRAEKLFKQAIKANERNAGAQAGLALLRSREGRGDESLRRLRRAVELDPDDGWIRYLLAREMLRGMLRAGESDRASVERVRELLAESVRLEPAYVAPRAARRTLGRMLAGEAPEDR